MISDSGSQLVFGDGVATSTFVTTSSVAAATSGGTLLATQLEGGFAFVDPGGSASGVVVGSGSLFGVFAGGVATGTVVESGALAGAFGSLSGAVGSGAGLMVSTTVQSGGLLGLLAGEADGTDVQSGGAVAVLGGVTSGTLLEPGGGRGPRQPLR